MSTDKPPIWIPALLGITAQSSNAKETRIQLYVSNVTIWSYLLTSQEKKNLKPGMNALHSTLFVRMLARHSKILPQRVPYASNQVPVPDWFFEKVRFDKKLASFTFPGIQIWKQVVPDTDKVALAKMPPREGLVYVSQNIGGWWEACLKNNPFE